MDAEIYEMYAIKYAHHHRTGPRELHRRDVP